MPQLTWRAILMGSVLGGVLSLVAFRMLVPDASVLGVVLAVLPVLFSKKAAYLPSAAGVGLAWTFHWYYSFLFFLGALAVYIYERKSPDQAEEFTFPVASGVIAGGSLMGVALVFWENGPAMLKQFFN